MKNLLLGFVALGLCLSSVHHDADASVGWSECTASFPENHHPDSPHGAVPICRHGILAISYDAEMINPAYSAYFLNHTLERVLIPGRDDFYEDPDLKSLGVTQARVDSPAFNISWNRGHLAPSHALSWTKDSKHSTYTMANVAPQGGYFNQHPWAVLESSVIDWTTNNQKSVHVITGVGYKDRSNPRRTFDGISVPDYYFKVLCNTYDKKSVGFYGDNSLEHAKRVSEAHDLSYIKEHIFPYELFPDDACKTSDLDKSYWSGLDEEMERQFAKYGLEVIRN